MCKPVAGQDSAPCWQLARLDVGQHQPRLLYGRLAHERGELLERLLWRDLLSLVLGIECIEPASWNGGTLSGQQCVVQPGSLEGPSEG